MPPLTEQRRLLILRGVVQATMVMLPPPVILGKRTSCGNSASEMALESHLSHGIQDHIQRVYDALRGHEPTLSREQVEAFFSTIQKRPSSLLDKQDYKFGEFLEVAWYNKCFQAQEDPPSGEKDLSKPISSYFISSSHNTYLSGNQLSSKSSTDAYKNVLIRGCRCIEIDVWNGEPTQSGTGRRSYLAPYISSSSLSQAASAVSAAVEQSKHFIDDGKHFISKKFSRHHRLSASNTDHIFVSDSEKTSAIDSDTFHETQEVPCSNHTSRHSSSSSSKTEPRVLHGWTLTSEVGFREVCATIRETAFLTTNLPIIVSLEVHADLDQQEVMVQIMKEEWKGLLVEEPYESCNPAERLPRLDELLNKILVKVKKATPITPTHGSRCEESSSAPLTPQSSNNLAPLKPPDLGELSGSEDERGGKPKKKKSRICESLSRLGVYTHSAHFTGFNQAEATQPPHVFSVSENQIQDLRSTHQAELFGHNRNYLMRAYPAGRRIDSSNPDPSTFWRTGVQMVALNWQSWDEGMMLNEAMFADEQGWVLKPPAYRCCNGDADPLLVVNRVTIDFKITVLAGQDIPLPLDGHKNGFCPHVKCELHVDKPNSHSLGPESGWTKEGKYKRISKSAEGTNPDFGNDGAELSFLGVPNVVEELSFVRLKIEDSRHTMGALAAWACIRLDRIQHGYRLIPLLNAKGQTTGGLLLVKIEKTVR